MIGRVEGQIKVYFVVFCILDSRLSSVRFPHCSDLYCRTTAGLPCTLTFPLIQVELSSNKLLLVITQNDTK